MSQVWGMKFADTDGTAVGVEATGPNTAGTDPNQQAALAPRMFRAKASGPGEARPITVFVEDGTSLAVECWVYDETGATTSAAGVTTGGRWWRVGASTVAAGVPATFPAFPGAKTFIRVVTNTGAVNRYAVGQA